MERDAFAAYAQAVRDPSNCGDLAWTFPRDSQHRKWYDGCWYIWVGNVPSSDAEWIEITWPLDGTDPAIRHGW